MFDCQECEVERSNRLSIAIHKKINHNIDSERYNNVELYDDVIKLQTEINQVRKQIKRSLRYNE